MSEDTENATEPRRAGNNGNLILPQKGEIRNPAGKPKGTRNRSTIIREMVERAAIDQLKSKIDPELQPKTAFEQLVAHQMVKASQGDTAAMNFIADGAFGKVTDKIQNTVTYKKMGKIIAEPVNPDPSKPVGAAQAFELTFDCGEDPLTNAEEEELEDNEQE